MSYTADSIQVKNFREACRSMPGMYIGTDGQDAAFNCFLEVLNNACDEAIMKRGDTIEIILTDDCNTLICKDNGAGVPHGKNKDCEEVLIELFTSAHSSGKFDTTNYKKVRGMHGIGTSAVCVCSTTFRVWTRRDGAEYYIEFIDGIPQMKTAQYIKDTKETGSTFMFTPDKQIFRIEGPSFDYERIRQELELTSYFIPNVTFTLEYKNKKVKYISKNGLKDFAKDKIQNPLHKSYIYGYKQFDDEVEVEVFAQWTAGKETRYIFSNGALNSDGGTPETGAKTAFTKTINSLSKGEFDPDMIRKGLVYIVNIRHPHPIYQNQTKNKIQNTELRGYTQTVFTEAIKDFANNHKDEFNKIIEILNRDRKAELAADKARAAVLSQEKKDEIIKKQKILIPDKFKDCEEHNLNSTLIICEGNSALAGLMPARNVHNEAIYAVRGKVKNLLKDDLDKCLENEEVSDIISILGCGIQNKYNSKKLNYGRVAIAVDGDADGFSIMTLISTLFYVLMPDFIKEERLCWLRAPIYKLQKGKNKYFVYSDLELPQAKNSHKNWEQTRIKGLGELNSEDMKESMLHPENRQLEILTIEDFNELSYWFELLMGKEVEPRTRFLFNNADFSEVLLYD